MIAMVMSRGQSLCPSDPLGKAEKGGTVFLRGVRDPFVDSKGSVRHPSQSHPHYGF